MTYAASPDPVPAAPLPSDADDEEARRLSEVLVPTAGVLVLATVFAMLTMSYARPDLVTWILIATFGLPTHVAVIMLARRGRGRAAALLLCAHTVGLVWAIMFIGGPAGPRLGVMNLAVVVLGWLLSERLTMAFGLVTAAALTALGLAAERGLLHFQPLLIEAPQQPFLRQAVILGVIVAVMRRVCERLIESVRGLERRREAAIAELRRLNGSLAQVVEEQTVGLETTRNQATALAGEVVQALELDVTELEGKLQHATRGLPEGNVLEDVQLAARSAARLHQMVENLATYARLGEITLNPVPIDMNALAAEVVALVRATPEGARVSWQVDALPPAFGDEILIRSVLENLIANAVKFSRRAAEPRVHLGHDPRRGRYFVADNGVGFDPSGTNRLFAPFCRLHDRKKFEGQGMGLANVRHIVERHYGSVEAEGQPGVGATFSFSLPSGENRC